MTILKDDRALSLLSWMDEQRHVDRAAAWELYADNRLTTRHASYFRYARYGESLVAFEARGFNQEGA